MQILMSVYTKGLYKFLIYDDFKPEKKIEVYKDKFDEFFLHMEREANEGRPFELYIHKKWPKNLLLIPYKGKSYYALSFSDGNILTYNLKEINKPFVEKAYFPITQQLVSTMRKMIEENILEYHLVGF